MELIMNNYTIDVSKLYPDDLMSEAHDRLAKEISDNYDNLIFSLLVPYGITRENLMDHIDRIVIVSADDYADHYMIDGEYRFSIIKETFWSDLDYCKFNVKYTVRVIEELKSSKGD